MPSQPTPDLGETWKSAEGVVGEIVGLEDEYAKPIEAVADETTGAPAFENYFVILEVPNATGPVRVQENTFLSSWTYLPG